MDTMVRYPNDPAPLIPGTLNRFRWPSDPHDTEVIRSQVQDRGRGLFVLETPASAGGTPIKVLAEAYYPEDIRPAYFHHNLDPIRQADVRMGRLVVTTTIGVAGTFKVGGNKVGSLHCYMNLTEGMIEELRRNNRAARADLKRQSSAVYRKQELMNAQAEFDDRVYDEFAERYAHMYAEGAKYALDPEHGGAIWRHNVTHRR